MISVAELLHFIPLDHADAARLAELHTRIAPELPVVAQQYIELLASSPATASSVATAAQQARMHDRVVAWLEAGLRGPHDDAFYAQRLRLGSQHIADEWPQHRTVPFVHIVRIGYQRAIAKHYESGDASHVLESVNRLLDLELALVGRHHELSHRERVREERDERLVSLRTLTAGLAHEIRNPLNAATLQLQLVERRLRRENADDQLRTPVELAQAELTRLTSLLVEFLRFAQPVRLNPQPHDVVALIAEVCERLRPQATSRGATLRFEPGVAAITAQVDGPKLVEVAEHLVRNGIEVVPSGGEVVVELTADEAALGVVVHDTGPGIPDTVRPRIFEPFFSTKDGGTGLGMSIVHSLVTLHGGSIRFATGPNGTRFEVSIPRD